jgi:hypothetical protein
VVSGLVWFTDGSRTEEGTGAGVFGQSVNRRLSISLRKYSTVFQAGVYAILACVGLFWVLGHAGVRGNEIADELARGGSAQRFVGPEPVLGVSRQNIRRVMKRWIVNKHLAL